MLGVTREGNSEEWQRLDGRWIAAGFPSTEQHSRAGQMDSSCHLLADRLKTVEQPEQGCSEVLEKKLHEDLQCFTNSFRIFSHLSSQALPTDKSSAPSPRALVVVLEDAQR